MNKSALVSYSLLGFSLAFIGLPLYIYLPNYYADNFGVSLKAIGVILLLTRIIDTIQDPIFWILSDKHDHLRRKIIFLASPVLGLCFLLLFYPFFGVKIEIWLIVFLILTYSIYSLIYINYTAYSVGFSANYNEKTQIISYREVAFVSGIIFAAAVPAFLFGIFGQIKSFFLVGVFYLLITSVFAAIFYLKAPVSVIKKDRQKVNLRKLLKNKDLQHFFAAFFTNMIAASIPASLILFFVERILDLKDLAGIFLLIYFSGLLCGVPFWARVSKKLNDKVRAWQVAILVTCFAFVWCVFLGAGDGLLYGVICFVAGFGIGADFCLGYSILTDVIVKRKVENQQVTIFGIANFLVKLSLALASGILVYLIGYFAVFELEFQMRFLSLSYGAAPVVFKLLTIYFLYVFKKNFN